MSLENFQPSYGMLTELYKNSVMILERKQAIPDSVNIEKPPYLGQFSKHLLIFVSYRDVQYLPDAEMELLTAILSACKISFTDIALINVQQVKNQPLKETIDALQPEIVIGFGNHDIQISGINNFNLFNIQIIDGKSIMIAPSLTELIQDAPGKKALWLSLRNLFSI